MGRRQAGRIIPAYAGSTNIGRRGGRRPGDHPRIRGEHPRAFQPISSSCGSSPHTRGALEELRQPESLGRIIPAYAGSTRGTATTREPRSDHPRIRGEHPHRLLLSEGREGSSPHTRGARRPGRRRTVLDRDHPRIRGEHDGAEVIVVEGLGSSPHTRGAPKNVFKAIEQTRIIPAYAGSTNAGRGRKPPIRDHPRIRGEHPPLSFQPSAPSGSSPHTRGAPLHGDRVDVHPGIIPAYAGSTSNLKVPEQSFGDHPRIRGEHPTL